MNVIAVITAAGCYGDPDYSTAGFKCDGTHGCPANQKCVSGTCVPGLGPAVGVECGGVLCDASRKCCVGRNGGPTCVTLTASCDGVAARCDGAEDCSGGACCSSMLGDIECGEATCRNQICRENIDCVDRSTPLCCLGFGLPDQPWGFCGMVCPTVE